MITQRKTPARPLMSTKENRIPPTPTKRPWSAGTIRAQLRPILLTISLFAGLFSASARADSNVTASLSQDTMTVDSSVDFVLTIEGGGQVSLPREIPVNGLEIRFSNQSEKTQIVNRQISSSVEITYAVSAKTAGTYSIPGLELEVNGKLIKTQELNLTVLAARAQDKGAPGKEQLYFAEITLPKSSGYLGEIIPVELRLYVDARVRWQAEQMPSIEGEGYTKQKMPEPRRETAKRGGRSYDVLAFRTAITPSKAGKIQIGPSEIKIQAETPQPNRSRTTVDDFFRGAFNQVQVEHVSVTAAPAELDVKPLPTLGRPKNYSGAVGQFTFNAEGSPKTVKVGDPITMKLKISGRGNFDRLNAPEIAAPEGWHTYPPSADFKPSDDLGIGGTKNFEMAVIPETRKSTMPVLSFSYFDPNAEKYVTLNSTAAALDVQPGAAPQAIATPAPATGPATPATPASAADIIGLRYDLGPERHTFQPLYLSRPFHLAQLWPAGALLLLLASRLLRKDPTAAQLAGLKASKSQLWRRLRSESLSEADFLDSTAQLIQIQTAIVSGRSPVNIDAMDAVAATQLDA